MPYDITGILAAYATDIRFADLPGHVRQETARTFLNWLGCVLGGCRERTVEIAVATAAETAGAAQATVIGHVQRMDIVNAAFLNCLSSSALAYDDTHLATVTHPTGPVAATLLALAERGTVSGESFVNALALGIEIECRLSNMLLLPPAQANLGFYMTGLSGPVGTAAACGRVLGLDREKMGWALGLAAAQSSGFRATHATMAAAFVPAQAARSGLSAAMLAAKGFTCSEHTLEAANGFAGVFATGADLGRAVDGLGQHFELLANAYKPYPCGIVIHPAIDACLDIAARLDAGAALSAVELTVHPLALALTGLRTPTTSLQTQNSLYHWAAAALLQGSAGLAQIQPACIDDPDVARLRSRISARADPALGRDEAIAEVTLADGAALRSHVVHARGSRERPMTDEELDAKFVAQASRILPPASAEQLLRLCRDVATLDDVGAQIVRALA